MNTAENPRFDNAEIIFKDKEIDVESSVAQIFGSSGATYLRRLAT